MMGNQHSLPVPVRKRLHVLLQAGTWKGKHFLLCLEQGSIGAVVVVSVEGDCLQLLQASHSYCSTQCLPAGVTFRPWRCCGDLSAATGRTRAPPCTQAKCLTFTPKAIDWERSHHVSVMASKEQVESVFLCAFEYRTNRDSLSPMPGLRENKSKK